MTGEIVPYKQRLAALDTHLSKMADQFAASIPNNMKPQRLARVIRTVVQNNPKLLECNPRTLMAASIQCAQLGLSPDPVMGEAFLIPFKDSVKLVMGYKGVRQLAFNHERVVGVSARAVHKNDSFEWMNGDTPFIRHRYDLECGDPGPIIGAWARVDLLNNPKPIIEVMPLWEIEKIKAFVKAKNWGKLPGPWVDWEDQQIMKTAIKRVFKQAPASAELRVAQRLDDLADMDEKQNLESVLDESEPAGASE